MKKELSTQQKAIVHLEDDNLTFGLGNWFKPSLKTITIILPGKPSSKLGQRYYYISLAYYQNLGTGITASFCGVDGKNRIYNNISKASCQRLSNLGEQLQNNGWELDILYSAVGWSLYKEANNPKVTINN